MPPLGSVLIFSLILGPSSLGVDFVSGFGLVVYVPCPEFFSHALAHEEAATAARVALYHGKEEVGREGFGPSQ